MFTVEQLADRLTEIATEARLPIDNQSVEIIRNHAAKTIANLPDLGPFNEMPLPTRGALQWGWHRSDLMLAILAERLDLTTELPKPSGFEDITPGAWHPHDAEPLIVRRWLRTLNSGTKITVEDTAGADGKIHRRQPTFHLSGQKSAYTLKEALGIRDGIDEALKLTVERNDSPPDPKPTFRRGRRRRKDIDLGTLSDPAIAYDVQAAADMLSLSYTEIKRAMEEGSLIAKTRGTKPLLLRAELERWIDNLPNWVPPRFREPMRR
ncbi:hypothetical protein [Prescottella agglutinans]|uniref:Helix-turn-helix domain-containing protein n=1 Tax=Prescottella agglutinans TaxID=1644129 RepID=A0ABT6MIB5_9NOCA|nr:hypothetical protein [Prescottella agglutinans]MDH6283551.1 hypothetical protein [Prescottella agglutinans]